MTDLKQIALEAARDFLTDWLNEPAHGGKDMPMLAAAMLRFAADEVQNVSVDGSDRLARAFALRDAACELEGKP